MEYKWKALSATSVGALMSAVDSTVVLLALFPIATDLKSDFVTVVWVILAYLLVNTALVLSLSRLSDLYGRKKMYNVGFIVFTIGSGLCGLAFSGISLVGFRAIQGIGAALLTANSFAILSEAFPRNESGRAFGMNAIVWSVGSILGIVLGGIIITFSTWRFIFLINVPIGMFATLWAYLVLRESKAPESKGSFDVPAALAFTVGLSLTLLGVSWGLLYSWVNTVTVSTLTASPIFFVFFFVWESKYSKDPIVDLTFFKNRVFSFSILATFLQFLAIFSVNFLLIFYLEGIDGLSVLNASYLIVPLGISSAIVAPFGGSLTDKIGAKFVSAVALGIQCIVLLVLSTLSPSTPQLEIALIECVYGVGTGLFWPSNTSSIMSSSVRGKLAVGSGIMNTFRNTGMIMSFAISLTAATSVIPSRIVYQLFIGNLTGKLPDMIASAYLRGESFAFEISALLVFISLIFVISSTSGPSSLEKARIPQS